MQAEVFWVPGPWRGRLAVVSRPRGGDWLDDETRAWREAAIDVVVSLLEPQEEADLTLAGEPASAKANRIEFRSYPIPDRGVPSSRESVAQLASEIVDALRAGRNVAVHCRQGVGRSGLIAAAVLIAAGADPETAVTTIGRSRGITVPETDEQRRWITDFASWFAEARAAKPAAAAGRFRQRPSG
jgi:protein-tyrosine phosphatase